MKKDFLQWALEKEKIEKKETKIICKKGQIWMAKIGINIGNESGKDHPFMRPIAILNPHVQGDLILICPLTSKYNEKIKRHLVPISHANLSKNSFLQVHQIRIISKKRLERDMHCKISQAIIIEIKNRLQEQVLEPRLSDESLEKRGRSTSD